MREDFVETLVKRKTNLGLSALMIFLYIICGVCVLLALVGGGLPALFIAIIAGISAYISGHYSKVEFEYSYCNKELDVDAIYAQTTRRHQVTLDLSKMEALVRVNSAKMKEFANRQCKTVNYASGEKKNADAVYALFYDGTTKYLIEPDDELLDAIKYMYARKVFTD